MHLSSPVGGSPIYTPKAEIHPKYEDTEFHCACGETFHAMSTIGGSQHLEICSQCHPFYSGKEKLMDTAGRIEKFHRRYAKLGAKPA